MGDIFTVREKNILGRCVDKLKYSDDLITVQYSDDLITAQYSDDLITVQYSDANFELFAEVYSDDLITRLVR